MSLNRTLVILTIDTENLPSHFPEILKKEREMVSLWKSEGILDQLFLRPTKNGAILIFNDIGEERVITLMRELPFYQFKKSMEIYPMISDSQI